MFLAKCLFQLWSPGQTGDLGQAAQKPVGVEGRIDIARAQAARLVQEIGVKLSGATPTHAQFDQRRCHKTPKESPLIHYVHVQTLCHHVGVMLLVKQFLVLYLAKIHGYHKNL